MKDKEKQIKEMAKDWDYVAHMLRFNDCYMLSLKQWSEPAREMVKLGWIKLPKDSVVLSREEYEVLTNDLDKGDYGYFESGFSQGYEKGSKETAEKILNELYVQFSADYLVGLRNEYKDWKYANLIKRYAKSVGIEIKE